MNKKIVQILVMILIAIMFIATIVITVIWKPTSDIGTVSSTILIQEHLKLSILHYQLYYIHLQPI